MELNEHERFVRRQLEIAVEQLAKARLHLAAAGMPSLANLVSSLGDRALTERKILDVRKISGS